jgi:hypothetical protein
MGKSKKKSSIIKGQNNIRIQYPNKHTTSFQRRKKLKTKVKAKIV